MKFVVRYFSSLLPREHGETGELPHWVDYSIHPASKLGLHNALLAVFDRVEILQAHGGIHDCAVFVVDDGHTEKLSREMANDLFKILPRGEVKWLDIKHFLLPDQPVPPPPATPSLEAAEPAAMQLPLFEHIHTPYDDLESPPHALDIDI